MPLNLIATKLMAPRPPQEVVERPRLLEQLGGGLAGKLTLLSAPAGSGKSTLLASWLKSLDRPTAWLSLDRGDNEPERFLLYLVSALQQVEPSLGEGLPELLGRSLVEVEPLIIGIINDFVRWNHSLTLVLDDYHLISEQKIHDAVEFLLDHVPPGLCLVMATRTDPPIGLSRLRVRRQLLEIRSGDLRFGLEETNTFLNDQLGLGLSSAAIRSLEERTEGWVAGLQLAALSLQGRSDKEHFVQGFAGSHHHLVDYLMDEVLERQTPEVRQFLQRTSILERFTAALCVRVSGQPESANILKHLTQANLFVIPLDDERKWYRYHQLFAEFLRSRLEESEGKRVDELHRQASTWFEQEGWPDEAVNHALLGQDFQRAGRLVEDIAFNLGVSWNNAQLIKYVERLPLELLPHFPRLCIYYGWALINTGRVAALVRVLRLIEPSGPSPQPPLVLRVCIITLRAYQQVWQMDFAAAIALCQEALVLLADAGEPQTDEERWMWVASTNLIAYSYLHSDLLQADRFYPQARTLSQKLGNFVGSANGFARHGRLKHQMGQLDAALELFEQGLNTLESWKARGGRVVNVGELHLNLARLLLERGHLEEAQTHLEQAGVLNQLSQFPPVLALEHQTRAQLYLARRETEAAVSMLDKLDSMLKEIHPSNRFYIQMFGVMTMQLRLSLAIAVPALSHLLDEVQAWVETHNLAPSDSFSYASEGSYLVLARLLLAQNKTAQALPLLGRLLQAARAEQRVDDVIRYTLLQALAQQSTGQEAMALAALHSVLEMAEPQGYCHSFVDMGAPLYALLKQLFQQYPTPYLKQLLQASSPAQAPQPPALLIPASKPDHPEPLSEREQTILRLLVNRNSNKEIAKALDLSPNTVRWYVSSLLSKLGVTSRLEAAHKARELNLL